MSTSIIRPLKHCIFERDQLIREQRFSSEEAAKATTDEQSQIIDRLIMPDEEKVVSWTGLALYYDVYELRYYHIASFVLTDKRLYVVGGTREQRFMTVSDMSMCTNFCVFDTGNGTSGLPEFTICFTHVISFIYEKGDKSVEWNLHKELRRLGVHED